MVLIFPIGKMVVQKVEVVLTLLVARRNGHVVAIELAEIAVRLFHPAEHMTLKLHLLRVPIHGGGMMPLIPKS